MSSNIVVITNGNYFARLILSNLFDNYRESISGVLIITGDYKARAGLRALWAIGKSTTTPYLIYKVFTVAAFKLAQRLRPTSVLSVETQARQRHLRLFQSISVNSDDAHSWVASLQPDLLVSVSCPQLIRKKMLSLAKLGGINIHSSLLPSYAGLAPYYWVLSTGEEKAGLTVHYMTQKFDAGNILVQKQLIIEPQESAFHLFKRLAILGSSALKEAVQLGLEESEGVKQDLSKYSYYSHPDLKSYLNLRKYGHVLVRPSELLETIRQEIALTKTNAFGS